MAENGVPLRVGEGEWCLCDEHQVSRAGWAVGVGGVWNFGQRKWECRARDSPM